MIYEIAGMKVEMEPRFGRLTKQCESYISSGKPVLTVTPNPGDVSHWRMAGRSEAEQEYILHSAAFCRSILGHERFFLHASAVVYQGEAYLFSAPSGTGKSTHTALWRKLFPDSFILNDDKPVIFPEKERITAWGTPFSGRSDLQVNLGVPIRGICFLKQGNENRIWPVAASEALALMLNNTWRPGTSGEMEQLLDMMEQVVTRIPIYKMCCTTDTEAAKLSYAVMKGT